jgi:hypothetical protein
MLMCIYGHYCSLLILAVPLFASGGKYERNDLGAWFRQNIQGATGQVGMERYKMAIIQKAQCTKKQTHGVTDNNQQRAYFRHVSKMAQRPGIRELKSIQARSCALRIARNNPRLDTRIGVNRIGNGYVPGKVQLCIKIGYT